MYRKEIGNSPEILPRMLSLSLSLPSEQRQLPFTPS